MSISKKPMRRRDLATPVIGVGDAWIRPGELLVRRDSAGKLKERLRDRGGRLYSPESQDWRSRRTTPEYGDINRRLERAGSEFELWVGFADEEPVTLVRDGKLRGVHLNHVYFGEDFYQGGPGGPPVAVSGPTAPLVFSGNQQVDIAVLDTGVPEDWPHVHPELKDSVHQVGINRLPEDPLDENNDNVLDSQAGHGLFICGVIARMSPNLDIELSRVLSSTGETDDALLGPALSETTAPVINLSLGGYTTNNQEPPVLAPIVRSLAQSGRVIVAAAGNSGGADPGSPFHGRPFWPAAMPEVTAVGALDSTRATPQLWSQTNLGEVYAPGVDLLSTYVAGWVAFKGWASWTGTSFATPVVAAKIAELLAAPHTGTAGQVVLDWINTLPATSFPTVPAAKLWLPPLPPVSW